MHLLDKVAIHSVKTIASASAIDLGSVIKSSNLDSLNRCISNNIYSLYDDTIFLYD